MTAPLLERATAGFTRTAPEGATTFGIAPPCPACGGGEVWSDRPSNLTYSVQPASNGVHTARTHELWCAALRDTTPALACPDCGAEVDSYEHRPGYVLAIPDALALGGVGHVVGAGDEVLNHPRAAFAAGPPRPAESFTKVDVEPCGHTIEGSAARELMIAAANFRLEQKRLAAEKVLAADTELLAAAEFGGPRAVADQYRQAVHAGSRDASGLRLALQILVGDPDAREYPRWSQEPG